MTKRTLADLSATQLRDIYNTAKSAVGGQGVSRFADKATALKRTEAALAAAKLQVNFAANGAVTVGPIGKAPLAGDLQQIRVLEANPKRGEAAKRFAKYQTGMTIADYVKKIGDRRTAKADIRYDVEHGHIALSSRPIEARAH